MRATASYEQRLATARLLHRFNFGPTPGQYEDLLQRGLEDVYKRQNDERATSSPTTLDIAALEK